MPHSATGQSNRLAKMAKLRFERLIRQQHAPFLPYELLYLRRDMAHMGSTNLAKLVEHLDALEPVRRSPRGVTRCFLHRTPHRWPHRTSLEAA